MMKKLFSTIFAILLSLSLMLTGLTFTAQADDLISAEDTVISVPPDPEASFADNRILVALTREASLKFKTYSTDDFADIGCAKITDLSSGAAAMTEEAMRQAINALTTGESEIAYAIPNKNKDVISNFKQILCLELKNSGKENVLAAIKILLQRDDVYCAEPDYELVLEDVDFDETSLSPNVMGPIGLPNSWAYDIIQGDAAYGLLTEVSPVVIGVIDTGIDGDHPYLQSAINVPLCRDFSTGEEVATGVPTDSLGHGTQIAGIIAAQGGSGVYSICSMAQVVSLRIASNYDNSPNVSYAIAAINYATTASIDVLNASFGFENGSITSQQKQMLSLAISNYNGVFVCSAGNSYSNNDTNPRWPSCYTHSNIISVGATDKTDQFWYEYQGVGSNYGATSVDVFAPGVDMHTTLNGGGTTANDEKVTGTSYAVPVVASIAAIILAQYPNMSASDVRQTIIDTVNPIEGLSGKCVSGGRVNAYRALASLLD